MLNDGSARPCNGHRRRSGIPEIVEDGVTGYLVEPGNVGELREALAHIVGDPPLAERMGAAARERVLAQFTWDRCADRCLDAYQSLRDRR